MKKIGILTFQNTMNYGALLQAFALQKFLERKGLSAEIINYINKEVASRETPRRITLQRGIKACIKELLFRKGDNKKRQSMELFSKRFLRIGGEEYLQDEEPVFSDYDSIIVGSDQVWNKNLTGNDLTYFLKNYDGKKYSYAASAGIIGSLSDQELQLLKSFKLIGVRETSLEEELERKGVESTTVLDPTLLLDMNDWSSYVAPRIVKKDYVLLYQMTTSDSILRFAGKVAKDNDCLLINANPIGTQILNKNAKNSYSPSEWLSLIKYAKCVITNSFHGLAFSINFRKDFFVEIKENEASNQSRLLSLLNMMHLEDRNVASHVAKIDKKVDYEKIEEIIKDRTDYSKGFVSKIIEDIMHE